jgi:2-keto-4-pentenoate hydratase/2-oxohepta-3-ene-1,7-dioic acid hydratase in catechol pathway
VTADEIPDIYNLRMTCRVNGEVWCDTNSSTIHWTFEQMIAHVSMDETLRPGDVLGSGTVGNGSGAERGTFLRRGDRVELEVECLGILRNTVV